MKYKVQTYLDIATSAESMQVLNFSVGGKTLKQRCMHLFQAYKYYKLGKISIKFVPASTLPVDPLGLSYADDDPLTVDPRDQLDCGLVRITHGEDIFDDLTGLSDEQMEGMYQAMLLDPHWYKFGLQSGFKRSAVPLYWQVGQLHQDYYPGSVDNLPRAHSTSTQIVLGSAVHLAGAISATDTFSQLYGVFEPGESDPRGLFQVGHRGRMGYLPTDALQPVPVNGNSAELVERPLLASIPEVRVITAVLPKMRKTLYYYRVYITEEIFFSGLKHFGPAVGSNAWYGGIDQFCRPKWTQASLPSTSIQPQDVVTPQPENSGQDE